MLPAGHRHISWLTTVTRKPHGPITMQPSTPTSVFAPVQEMGIGANTEVGVLGCIVIGPCGFRVTVVSHDMWRWPAGSINRQNLPSAVSSLRPKSRTLACNFLNSPYRIRD